MKKGVLSVLFIITISIFIQPLFHSPGLAQNLPDTVRVECLKYVPPERTVTAEITIWNDELLCGFSIPLTFDDPYNTDIVCDSISWSQTFWDHKPALYGANIDSTEKELVVYLVYFTGTWPIGDNSVATLHFTTGPSWDGSIAMTVDSTCWDNVAWVELVDCTSQITPHEFIAGCQSMPSVPTQTSWGLIIIIAAVAGLFGCIILRRAIPGTR